MNSFESPEYLVLNELVSTESSFLLPSSIVKSKRKEKTSIEYPFFISDKFSISSLLFTNRGAENVHVYLWILKDLSWTQGFYYPSIIFGALALFWCIILVLQAAIDRNYEEIYMLIAVTLWLFGNFYWMYGEIVRGDDDINAVEGSYILEVALIWILCFHVVLQPLGLLTHNCNTSASRGRLYEEIGLHPRFSYFKSWRQYEHIHTFFWCGKDWSWMRRIEYSWIAFSIPTVLIAVDFIWSSFRTRRMMIETVHYIAILMWIIGNLVWGYGELYISNDDDPIFIFNNPLAHEFPSNASLITGDDYMLNRTPYRWFSSWIIFSALFPIVLLYSIWIPLTITNKIT